MKEPPSTREGIFDLLIGEDARSYIADQFGKYAVLPYLARFLMRYELFKKIVDVHGSVIECGVGGGSGFIAWHQISKLLEPHNRRRIVYGFDTWEGFPRAIICLLTGALITGIFLPRQGSAAPLSLVSAISPPVMAAVSGSDIGPIGVLSKSLYIVAVAELCETVPSESVVITNDAPDINIVAPPQSHLTRPVYHVSTGSKNVIPIQFAFVDIENPFFLVVRFFDPSKPFHVFCRQSPNISNFIVCKHGLNIEGHDARWFDGDIGALKDFSFNRATPCFEPANNHQTKGEISYQQITNFRFAKKLFPPTEAIPRLILGFILAGSIFFFGVWRIEKGENYFGGIIVLIGGLMLAALCWIVVLTPTWMGN